MSKTFGRATYSAYRLDGIVHIVAEGTKPSLQVKVTIEPLPFLIYPPRYALYFDTPGIVSPVMMPFEIEKAISNYPGSPKFISIQDATGLHTITIEERALDKPLAADFNSDTFCVFQQIGTDQRMIAACNAILPLMFIKVFGPASRAEAQHYIDAHNMEVAVPLDVKKESFKAWIDAMPGGPHKLIVIGDVMAEVDADVKLIKSDPQGINPNILILDVKVTSPTEGHHSNAIVPKAVRFQESPPAHSYSDVTIRMSGTSFTIPVETVQ